MYKCYISNLELKEGDRVTVFLKSKKSNYTGLHVNGIVNNIGSIEFEDTDLHLFKLLFPERLVKDQKALAMRLVLGRKVSDTMRQQYKGCLVATDLYRRLKDCLTVPERKTNHLPVVEEYSNDGEISMTCQELLSAQKVDNEFFYLIDMFKGNKGKEAITRDHAVGLIKYFRVLRNHVDTCFKV